MGGFVMASCTWSPFEPVLVAAVLHERKYDCRCSLKTELIAETNAESDWDHAEVAIIEI